MTSLDVLVTLARSLPALVLVAALFGAAARRLESRVRLLIASRLAWALLLLLLAWRFESPLLALAALARIACGILAARFLLPAGRPSARDADLRPGKLVRLAGAGAFGALGYAATGEIAALIGIGGDAFRAAAGTALIGMFTAVTRTSAPSQALGLLVLSDGAALATITATRGAPSFAALVIVLDVGLLLAESTLAARPAPPSGRETTTIATTTALGEATP